jgi:hypothetical protein
MVVGRHRRTGPRQGRQFALLLHSGRKAGFGDPALHFQRHHSGSVVPQRGAGDGFVALGGRRSDS